MTPEPEREPEPDSDLMGILEGAPLVLPPREYPPRVLFLDDDRLRATTFLAECPHGVWVQTAADCIAKLAEPWDEVHLDHDLGGEQFVDINRDDCGMEVVRWICLTPQPHLKSTDFYVHSHNSVAATVMGMQMTVSGFRCKVRPFGLSADSQPFSTEDAAPPLSRWRRIKRGVLRLFGVRDDLDPAFYDYMASRPGETFEDAAPPRLNLDWLDRAEAPPDADPDAPPPGIAKSMGRPGIHDE